MFGFKKRIYLDYASATPLHPAAAQAMGGAEALFGNPGAPHAEGIAAKAALEEAREDIAHELQCKSRQIVFTSGLTESNNLAILGFARRLQLRGGDVSKTHWITSAIEHDSILEVFGEIERLGGLVTFVDPDERGIIDAERIARAIRTNTVFVSIGWANSEIGTVQPLREISRVLERNEQKIFFHSDAGQAPLYLMPHVHTLGVDMLSLGSGKLYGPRTIGALYVRDPQVVAPIILGGGQERGLRAGTEKLVPAIGFAAALKGIAEERESESRRLEKLRDDFARELLARVPQVIVNGALKHALPHMLNISIEGEKSGEYLALELDRAGIAVSTKSACNEGEQLSHVVVALGDAKGAVSSVALAKEERAKNTLRFSLGRETSVRDLDRALAALSAIAKTL